MCGIVAAAARRNVVPLLIEGLRRLEYRGYDSCGIATVGDDGLRPRTFNSASCRISATG